MNAMRFPSEVFTAEAPEAVGEEKYDETSAGMIALLKYGSGVPFHRLEKLENSLGIPLAASTQWEIVEETAEVIKPALEELIRQAAQGEVLHNDDTSANVLALEREPGDERTGVFTSGIVSVVGSGGRPGQRMALFFTGRQHAGENLADVLKRRAAEHGPPIQMSDALSRNTPKLSGPVEILVANCLAHGRRQFVEVLPNFPDQCRHVLESLGEVYHNEALAREQGLSPEQRLWFHQERSAPVLKQLQGWLTAQLVEKKTEPNSGLGKAISYLLKHWEKLTLFLRQPGVPLDNNICERALKKAILHRKNALFYRTLKGAQVGDLFMSLIHTLRAVRSQPVRLSDRTAENSAELTRNPSQWMPWNYREALQQAGASVDSG
jgi:transposase